MRKKSLLVIVLSLELVLLRGMNWGFHLAIVLGGVEPFPCSERRETVIDEQRFILCNLQGMTEEVALHHITTQHLEHMDLLMGLHALGYSRDAKLLGHGDDMLHHHLAPMMFIRPLEEALVEFDLIDCDILEHGQ